MKKKSFPTRAVLTCASPYAFIEASGMFWMNEFLAQLKPVCDFMTQTKNWNHDVPRITDEIKPYILEQHPWIRELNSHLDSIDDGDERSKEAAAIIKKIEAEHGTELELIPMHPEDHIQIDDPWEAFETNYGFKPDIIELDTGDDNNPSVYGDIN